MEKLINLLDLYQENGENFIIYPYGKLIKGDKIELLDPQIDHQKWENLYNKIFKSTEPLILKSKNLCYMDMEYIITLYKNKEKREVFKTKNIHLEEFNIDFNSFDSKQIFKIRNLEPEDSINFPSKKSYITEEYKENFVLQKRFNNILWNICFVKTNKKFYHISFSTLVNIINKDFLHKSIIDLLNFFNNI